jgi:hypothetical protein
MQAVKQFGTFNITSTRQTNFAAASKACNKRLLISLNQDTKS